MVTTVARRKRRCQGLKISLSIVYTRFLWRVVSYFFRFRRFWPVFRLSVPDLWQISKSLMSDLSQMNVISHCKFEVCIFSFSNETKLGNMHFSKICILYKNIYPFSIYKLSKITTFEKLGFSRKNFSKITMDLAHDPPWLTSERPIFSQTRGFWGLKQNIITVKQISNARVTKLVYFGNWIGPYWNDLTRFQKISRFWNNFKKRISIFWPQKTTKSIGSVLSQIVSTVLVLFRS